MKSLRAYPNNSFQLKYFAMKTFIIVSLLIATSHISLFSKTIILGTSTDIDPTFAQDIYMVGMGTYDRAEAGTVIKLITATHKPILEKEFKKEAYPNRMREQAARKSFESSFIRILGSAIQANKDKVATAFIDTPRLIRELRNHTADGDDTVVVVLGNTVWTGNADHSFIDHNQSVLEHRFRRPSHGSIVADKFLSPFSMEGIPQIKNTRAVWFNPVTSDEFGNDAYHAEVTNFWNCMFNALSITMSPVQSNASTTLDLIFAENADVLRPVLNTSEEGIRMISVAEMTPEQTFYSNAPAFTHVWVADLSPSQSRARESMARHLADSRGIKGEYHGLFVFESDGGVLYSENADVLELAAAFRQVKPKGGADSPDSFSETLKRVRDELRKRRSQQSVIHILSDVAPRSASPDTASKEYLKAIKDMISDGHSITFIRTNPRLDVRAFLPKDTNVKITDL